VKSIVIELYRNDYGGTYCNPSDVVARLLDLAPVILCAGVDVYGYTLEDYVVDVET
jgi:hypothetical protein